MNAEYRFFRRQLPGAAVAGQPPVFSAARHAEYRVSSLHRQISTAADRAESPRSGCSGVECPVEPEKDALVYLARPGFRPAEEAVAETNDF
jgi:hypothetical protein